jgi:hypothetical protein
MLSGMLGRLSIALTLVAAAACSRSKLTGQADGAIPANDGAPLSDAFDSGSAGRSDSPPAPDVGSGGDTVADEPGSDLARDVPVLDTPTTNDGSSKDAAGDPSPWDAARDSVADGNTPDETIMKDAAGDPRPDGTATGDALAAFCTGNLVRLATNGNPTGPAIRSFTIPMDCCDGVGIEIDTATFVHALYVSWLVPAGNNLPLDEDLSAPSSIQSFHVSTDCTGTDRDCKDTYSSGFVGRLQMWRGDGGYGYQASLCVHVEESADSPHSQLHSFDLYVPEFKIR